MGNTDALASAYSLYDYVIANDLGGYEAYENLRERAARRGIRLASDMVPNHTGHLLEVDRRTPGLVHPGRAPAYPSYSFNGPDLSYDDRVGIQIEDGYWNRTDAAVVFKRWDKHTGHTRYIYHGNDGTNMPWNDTAQLNYLIPEVREAVIQTILQVARMFPIIRFDAAMTLAKRHYQRLWFPKPGDGGAVPSRAEFGMTRAEFDEHMPEEFWREVVDRVAQEAPDTLLLAEAFWLMEGYFVRTLGMHRVYNSAFMNMLKMEKNADYRTTVKNVLEFSPQVLKRFVNFMNNPDELTAVEQFGKGDKYIGVAMMMVTMPGLPMFGHGQVEGFTEKYGMEYRRAHWDERPDMDLVRRHEAEVFPLMHKRYLFSGVEHFALYDFHTPGGWVDENVFAYSNRAGDERALILYNNAYSTTSGWVRNSTPINVGEGGKDVFVSRSLAEALGLSNEENRFYLFRDYRDGQEYLRSGRQLSEEGMFVQLRGYQYHAFLDWREIEDADGSWRRLADELQGAGVRDLEGLYHEMVAFPMAKAFRLMLNGEMLCNLAGAVVREAPVEESVQPSLTRFRDFLRLLEQHVGRSFEAEAVVRRLVGSLQILQGFEERVREANLGEGLTAYLLSQLPEEDAEPIWYWRIPVAWAVLDSINEAARGCRYDAQNEFCIDEWDLLPAVRNAFNELGYDWQAAELGAQLVRILVNYRDALQFTAVNPHSDPLLRLLDDDGARQFLQVNRYEDVWWFNREQFEHMVCWLFFVNVAHLLGERSLSPEAQAAEIFQRYQRARRLLTAAEEAQYRLEELRRLLD
jgi:glycosidase